MQLRTMDLTKNDLLLVNDSGLETLGSAEAEDGHGVGVELLLGTLVVVTLACWFARCQDQVHHTETLKRSAFCFVP